MARYHRRMQHHYIREWRKHRRLTLRQLCERLENEPGEPLVSESQLAKIERGEQNYRQEYLEAIAVALNTTPAMLLSHNPLKQGEVVDISHLLEKADPAQRNTIIAMIRAALGA